MSADTAPDYWQTEAQREAKLRGYWQQVAADQDAELRRLRRPCPCWWCSMWRWLHRAD